MSEELDETTSAEVVEQVQEQPIPEPSNNGKAHLELNPRELAIAEDRDPDEVPAEPTAEATAEATPAEETAAAPVETLKTWYADYDRQVARDYGLDDDDLRGLSSREEFGRVLKALSKRQQQAPAETKAVETPVEAEYVDEPTVGGKVNVEWFKKHEYDEGTIAAMQAQRDWQDRIEQDLSSRDQAEQRRQQAEIERNNQRELNEFHRAIDTKLPEQLYGKTADQHGNPLDLTPAQSAAREKVFKKAFWLAQEIAHDQQAAGLPLAMPSWDHLVSQASQIAHPDELRKFDEEKRKAAAQEQSRTIRPAAGSGATHARRIPVTNSDDVSAIANDPEVVALFEKSGR